MMELKRRLFKKHVLDFQFRFKLKIRRMTDFEYVSRMMDERTDIDYLLNARPDSYEATGKLIDKDNNSSIDYNGWVHVVCGLNTYRFYFDAKGKLIAASVNNHIRTIGMDQFEGLVNAKPIDDNKQVKP